MKGKPVPYQHIATFEAWRSENGIGPLLSIKPHSRAWLYPPVVEGSGAGAPGWGNPCSRCPKKPQNSAPMGSDCDLAARGLGRQCGDVVDEIRNRGIGGADQAQVAGAIEEENARRVVDGVVVA